MPPRAPRAPGAPRRSRGGVTVLEMLLALAVLATMMAIAYGAMSAGLRGEQQQAAITSQQATLRRLAEVVTQDVRGAVFGGLSNQPYRTDGDSLSFTLLDGGAGYHVQSDDPAAFPDAAAIDVVTDVEGASLAAKEAAMEAEFEGRQAMLVNGNRQAVLLRIARVDPHPANDGRTWRLAIAGGSCANMIAHTPNTLLLAVRTVGLEYDPAAETLFQHTEAGGRQPLAFDLADFSVDYVYQGSDGSVERRDAPYTNASGAPRKHEVRGGVTLELRRIFLNLRAEEAIQGGSVERVYSAPVDLAANQVFTVGEVSPCN